LLENKTSTSTTTAITTTTTIKATIQYYSSEKITYRKLRMVLIHLLVNNHEILPN